MRHVAAVGREGAEALVHQGAEALEGHDAQGGAAQDASGPTSAPGHALTDRQLAVLALEGRRYRRQGAKEQAVRDELGLSATRYYQVLNALLDDPAALALEPVLVNRLRRLREQRTSDAPT